MLVDLHNHTLASDGQFDGAQMVEYLVTKHDLSALAITDHDTTDALKDAEACAKNLGVSFIPGIEASTYCRSCNLLPHILGYFKSVDAPVNDSWLQESFAMMIEKGFQRIKTMCELSQENPIFIDGKPLSVFIEETQEISKSPHPTRSACINSMVQKKIVEMTGYLITMKDVGSLLRGREDVFKKYHDFFMRHNINLYPGQKTWFFPRDPTSLPKTMDVIKNINRLGGVSVLAHPCDMQSPKKIGITEDQLKSLCEHGLRGIEVFTPKNSRDDLLVYAAMAEKYGLVVTGGTDFHGPDLDVELRPGYFNGDLIPDSCFTDLTTALS